MRIFTAMLATETNTFSPIPTGWSCFEEAGIERGAGGTRGGTGSWCYVCASHDAASPYWSRDANVIAYSTIGVNDMARSIAFYDAVFAPLGAARETTSDTWTGYRRAGDRARFFLTRPFDRATANNGNGAMLAFLAEDRAAVDAFHAAALAHGGVCEGPPGVREGMDPVFYAAYVRDPDGAKLCAFVRK